MINEKSMAERTKILEAIKFLRDKGYVVMKDGYEIISP